MVILIVISTFNHSLRFSVLPILFGLVIFAVPSIVSAQAEVRDSSANPSVSSPAASSNASLVYELQVLQQEILSLRGQLEQQGYELKRLKQQRLDDYLDLDKRVSALTKQQNTAANTSVSGTQSTSNTASITTGNVSSVIPTNNEQSKQLYNDAIDLLLNKQDYEGSDKKFTQYLEQYPKGEYTPNIYYWRGQILFAGSKKEEAKSIFAQLINEYPEHAKVPDAKFKLAKIYFDEGKKDDAKAIFDELATSDTDAALLAKSFLSKNY